MSTPSTVVFKPKTPIMGGLAQITTTKWQAFTGGKPNVNYDALESPPQASHHSQYRAIGTEDSKGSTSRTEWPHSKISQSSSIVTVKDLLHEFFKQHGMDTISYLVVDGAVRSVVDEIDQFEETAALAAYDTVSAKYDSYCKANDLAAAKLFLNAMDSDMHETVTTFYSPTGSAGFVPYWFAYVDSINGYNLDRKAKLEEDLKAIVVTNYAQQNLELMVNGVKDICDDLADC